MSELSGGSAPAPIHPSIPRVLCPQCGNGMRLAKIEPFDGAREENTTFDCRCGFTFTCSAQRVR